MITLKFSNVKYYTGGGKTPLRIRHNQNYSIPVYLNSQKWLLDMSNESLINNLGYITKFKVVPSTTTTIKRIKS